MPRSLVVCDDDSARRADWAEAVRPFAEELGLAIVTLSEQDFMTEIRPLEKRRGFVRGTLDAPPESCLLDDADLVIVDFDLVAFNDFLTGETVAYLARCFSSCGYILGLNQFGAAPFDLTLRGHRDSFADTNLGGQQLSNPGLWGEPFVGFRPWSWPILGRAISQLRECADHARDHLESPVAETFFPGDLAKALPRSRKEFLVAEAHFSTATFHDFVLESGNALQSKDTVRPERLNPDQLGRIAASRLTKWLERSIFPGQDVIVDAPHLVNRFPSLLKGDRDDIDAWNATTTFDRDALHEALHADLLQDFEVDAVAWISRPTWWWPRLSQSKAIHEVADPWKGTPSDFVFCEDLSRFVRREAAREFVADVESPFARRYVLDPKSEEAQNVVASMKSAAGRWGEDVDPLEMEYRPAVRFVM